MTSHDVVELALRNRITELEAELRETKARTAALEIKAKGDAKKLADFASIVGNGTPGIYGASDADSGHLESPAFAVEESELGDALETVPSGQTDLTNTLQEENERLKQSAQAAPSPEPERSPTPVGASHSDVPSDDQSSESLLSYLARMPEGIQFPRVVKSQFTIRVMPSADGSMIARNDNIPNEPGWREELP